MDKIATREFANTIVPSVYTSNLKRCITYSSVNAIGSLEVDPAYSGKYTNATNRLVLTSELEAVFVPPATNQVQFKVRLLFDIVDVVVASCKIGIGNWAIRNSSGYTLAEGVLSDEEYSYYDLLNTPTENINQESYYCIDLYISKFVNNTSINKPYYIYIDSPIFKWRPDDAPYRQGYVTVVNNSASTSLYGYKLLDSSTDTTTKHLILHCRASNNIIN